MKMKKGFRVGCFGLALAMGVSAGSITTQAAIARFEDECASNTWNWAREAINWAYDKGISVGKGNHCFDADGKITRAEAVTMLVKFKKIDVEEYNSPSEKFKDLGENWYTKYVNAAYENGWVEGKSEDIFNPEGELTRAEAATMLVKAMEYEIETEQTANFEDIADKWYTNNIYTAYKHGIVAGKTEKKFEPDSEVTRAEMVTMIYAALKEMDNNIYAISVDTDNTDFTISDETGEILKCEKGVISGSIAKDVEEKDGFWYIPAQSREFVLETENDQMYVNFNRTKEDITFSGTNVKKVQVTNDGTIKAYSANISEEREISGLDINFTTDFTIINAEGQKLVSEIGKFSGDMEVIQSMMLVDPSGISIDVKPSESFTYIPVSKDRPIRVSVYF